MLKALRASRALMAALLITSASSCGPGAEEPTPASADRASPATDSGEDSAHPGPTASATERFEPLLGRWLRSDGGYVLEIWAVSPEGKVEAAYLNPSPIHIARAEAAAGAGALTLLVELQDVNYPGSLYHLTYDAALDALEGTYFQAVEQQTFEVSFVRQ